MWHCCVFYLPLRVINVTTVVLVISTHVDHWTMKCFVSPLNSTRFQIDIASEDNHVCNARNGIEPSKFVVQIKRFEVSLGITRPEQDSAHFQA